MATDKRLIEQIQHGKREAYGELFRKHYPQIYAVCLATLKNPQDAEEVAQETFVQGYLKLNQLKKPDKFLAWLKKIAQNRCKNDVRQAKPETAFLELARAQTAYPAPDEHLLRQELLDAIMEVVEALPPKDREVVRAHIEGLNHAEISERFGISVQASMGRLYRARKMLAAQVKGLLNAVIGLPSMIPLRKLISGGITTMKVGTGTKVTVGILGILTTGFIGFQLVLNQPDVQSPQMVTQQQMPKESAEARVKATRMVSISQPKQTDKPPEPTAEEWKKFEAFLRSLDAEEDIPPEVAQENITQLSYPQDESLPPEEADAEIIDIERNNQHLTVEQAVTDILTQRVIAGYEARDVDLYASAFWADDFTYHSDLGTADPTDDLVITDFNTELDGIHRAFSQFRYIKVQFSNLVFDFVLSGEDIVQVQTDYEVEATFIEDNSRAYPSGIARFTFKKRNGEWRISRWEDIAFLPEE